MNSHRMDFTKPLKRFGQNYLVDKNIVNKIVDEVDPLMDDIFIEIWPGHGILTQALVQRTNNLLAVEIDKRVIDEIKIKYPGVEVINEDFLKLKLVEIYERNNQKLRIAGNIPYNITSPRSFKLIENYRCINDAVFMVQYEVAKRMVSQKGSKDYGIMAVILQYFADVKFCFKVSPNVFYPKPKVDSAVIHIKFRKKTDICLDDKLFIQVVKAAFGNRRKILKNSINNSIFGKLNFEYCEIDLNRRAEELSLNSFVKLTNFIHGRLNG